MKTTNFSLDAIQKCVYCGREYVASKPGYCSYDCVELDARQEEDDGFSCTGSCELCKYFDGYSKEGNVYCGR